MKRVMRGDRIEFPHGTKTKEGFIDAFSIVTRTGVFVYRNDDGTLRRELRHPDDVFKKESLDSLRGIPITVNHPTELVNSENVDQYQVGSVRDKYDVDGKFVRTGLTVHHKRGVDSVDNGPGELSLGYEIVPVVEAGEYNGINYDVRQTEIEYNHLAIVDQARAGKDASIKMDSGNFISISNDIIKQVSIDNADTKTKNDKPTEAIMKIVVIDGVAVTVEDAEGPKLEGAIASMTKKVVDAESEKIKLQAASDAKDAEITKLKVELEKATSTDTIDARVKGRSELETKARKIMGDSADFTGKTDSEIKKEAVLKDNPEAKVDQGESYIDAYFDIASEKTVSTDSSENNDEKPSGSESRKVINTKKVVDSTSSRCFDSEDEDRNAMMTNLSKAGA